MVLWEPSQCIIVSRKTVVVFFQNFDHSVIISIIIIIINMQKRLNSGFVKVKNMNFGSVLSLSAGE